MGGDGGVIATNRKYLRGISGPKANPTEGDCDAQIQIMTTCALTGAKLDYSNIVACPYGKLYQKEAAVKALLRRIEGKQESEGDGLGSHIRGLKDLFTVRFNVTDSIVNGEKIKILTCPVTQVELNGIQPALLIVQKKSKKNSSECKVNVISEKAIKEIGAVALQEEYGPFYTSDCIRLAPPSTMMDEIKLQLEKHRSEKATSIKKKRKNESTGSSETEKNRKLI